MGYTITARPNVVNGVSKSFWTAARNPVLYRVRREDDVFNQINDNGGDIELQINGVDRTAYYEVGNSVYVLATSAPALEVTGVITASSFSGGNTLVTIDVPYSASTSGIVNNTSKRTDWKIEFEIYNQATSATLTGMKSRSNPDPITWIAICDVSEIIKNYVRSEWSLPSGTCEAETDTWIKFYIRTQEYYDGALISAPTSDSLNPIQAVHAAMQIFYMGQTYPDGGNLQNFIPANSSRQWMTRFWVSSALHKMRMWRGYPFTLSVLYDDGELETLYCQTVEFDSAGNYIQQSRIQITSATDKIARIKLGSSLHANTTRMIAYMLAAQSAPVYAAVSIQNGTFTGTSVPWLNSGSGNPWAYSADDVRVTLAGIGLTSQNFMVELDDGTLSPIGGYLRMTLNITIPNTKQVDIKLIGRKVEDGTEETITQLNNQVGTGANQVKTVTLSFGTVYRNYSHLGFQVSSDDTTAGQIIVTEAAFEFAPADVSSVQLNIDVENPCRNPVYLFWKNSAGGDSQYMFQHNQENFPSVSEERKAMRSLLSVYGITAVEWHALCELLSDKPVYRENIIELSSEVVKTHTRINQQVYVIDQDGNKIGVITHPTRNSLMTRRVKNLFELEIEYPETFE